MTRSNRLDFATRCIHAGQEPDPTTGAVMMPIYATSTYVQQSPGVHKGYDYARTQESRRAWRSSAASPISKAAAPAFAFASGLAAISTSLECLDQGSHVISVDDLYGGSRRLFERVRKRSMGIEVELSSICADPDAIEAAIRPNTRLIWVETPTNPLLKLVDLERVAAIAKKRGIWAAADNTFASPYVQRPLEHGFDLVVHSTTKYLNGHSDMVGGVAVVGRQRRTGASGSSSCRTPSAPFKGRSIRSWRCAASRPWRCAWSGIAASALKIAAWLERHPKVRRVFYPGLASHPQHALAKKQMRAFGGMISAELDGTISTMRAAFSSAASCSRWPKASAGSKA